MITRISIASGPVEIKPIWRDLGAEKVKALPIYLAFTDKDNVGRFSGTGKTRWFRQYMKGECNVTEALMKRPVEGDLTQQVKYTLAKFVYSVYWPRGIWIKSIPDLRWYLVLQTFNLTESKKLPHTFDAFEEHVNRVCTKSGVEPSHRRILDSIRSSQVWLLSR